MNFLRIRFVIPKHYYLLFEKNKPLILNIDQGTLTFSISTTEETIYRIYSLKSNDFTFELSNETIQKIVDSLYLLCIELDIGILVNSSLPSSWVNTTYLEERMTEKKIKLENEFFGAKVFSSGSAFIGVNTPMLIGNSSIYRFEELLNKYCRLKYKKSDNLLRAIEIYNSSNFLTVINRSARFILLMSAVETLIDQPTISKRLQNSIDSYMKRLKKLKIKKEEIESIQGSLKALKRKSIKSSGKILIEYLFDNDKRYNGFPPSTFFSKAYDLRSKFVHYGLTKTKDLDVNTIQMQDFVKEMIKSFFEKSVAKKIKL